MNLLERAVDSSIESCAAAMVVGQLNVGLAAWTMRWYDGERMMIIFSKSATKLRKNIDKSKILFNKLFFFAKRRKTDAIKRP